MPQKTLRNKIIDNHYDMALLANFPCNAIKCIHRNTEIPVYHTQDSRVVLLHGIDTTNLTYSARWSLYIALDSVPLVGASIPYWYVYVIYFHNFPYVSVPIGSNRSPHLTVTHLLESSNIEVTSNGGTSQFIWSCWRLSINHGEHTAGYPGNDY